MLGDVAVVDEVADIESSAVHPHLDAREGMLRVTVPEWHLHRVEELPLDAVIRLSAVHFEVVLTEHQEVILMSVKLMVLQRPVLDSPVLDCTQRGHDAGRIVGVEERGRGPRP